MDLSSTKPVSVNGGSDFSGAMDPPRYSCSSFIRFPTKSRRFDETVTNFSKELGEPATNQRVLLSQVLESEDFDNSGANAATQAINGAFLKLPSTSSLLPRELDSLLMPRHVAIIMDGNSRWAKRRGWNPNKGHEAGVQALRKIVQLSNRWGIKVLTVFAFSIENWFRPKAEVAFLLFLFERVLADDSIDIFWDDVSVHVIGDLSMLPASLQRLISGVQNRTRDKTGLKLVIALSYSGRQDIVQACRSIASDVKSGRIQNLEEIDEATICDRLMTSKINLDSDPDLLIRTSGEMRLSNFLLWQLAYTELFFVDTLWPDFGEADYRAAIRAYQKRERRFGKHCDG